MDGGGRSGGSATVAAGLSASFERLSRHADAWGPERVLCEGLDLVRDASWADECHLYSVDDRHAVEVASRPGPPCPDRSAVPTAWFPWGLAPVNPRRFLLISDAAALPSCPDGGPTLGELGATSCLHLPILERQRPIGALHLLWGEPHLAWDDDRGRLLRVLGAFLLARALPTDPTRSGA